MSRALPRIAPAQLTLLSPRFLARLCRALTAGGEKPSTGVKTHIVKERVREERTYMDERGYMICEEVRAPALAT